jgi:hypothetical protein
MDLVEINVARIPSYLSESNTVRGTKLLEEVLRCGINETLQVIQLSSYLILLPTDENLAPIQQAIPYFHHLGLKPSPLTSLSHAP